ncbi:MAG: alpha-amylase [Anaerolineae bacterium]|nr:alpha-amylase [Anaerolineae bacterium]
MMEFHISRQARDLYRFDASLFSLSGSVLFADFHAVRVFAQEMNERRDLISFPEQSVKAGQINAMGLIDEVLHYVIGLYRQQRNPSVWGEALGWLYERLGRQPVDETLRRFADEFPPVAVYRREVALEAYLEGSTEGVPHRQLVLEEMMLLWLANANPATAPFQELFDDAVLERETAYRSLVAHLQAFFHAQPSFGPEGQDLVGMLHSPAVAVPHSLSGQLEYIRERWGYLIGSYLYRLLSSLDLIKEEEKLVFGGPGRALVYDFRGLEAEYERFSSDSDWMPRAVLLAKNSYVWLDQLSKEYGRSITRLDQIPDQELDKLARWGFTGLWLIGLWERSRASRTIKQMCGNPEAVASAYSLFDYRIADGLGGHQAYENLRARAWARGVRLASDMVPNHVGIDSPWVIDHPDWFIGQDHSPFPAYTFGGPDLSWDGRVGIYLEDHYYDRTDAAVVFRLHDRASGRERYIFHGNDGTSMPWNDTAQLNYLDPVVREAVTRKILDVARMFPIIRFDAAMTLAKRHFRRLWYPEPGSGGAIPGRAAHGMTAEQFDALMPSEFWRDVVDRVAQEAPDTLLLAEAFWMMEGHFVRTLGMHRVYNSAFMNMLRDERNAEYRLVIRNTLEFDPRILARYVNFMNNPDERTAIDQFGSGDKYLGICTLMATMPGLPMFGHGQVEGLREKYGMEYRRAYWDEGPDPHLVAAHESQIFPLLRQRHLFAGAESFLLYDLVSPEGFVNEDVFAYSNAAGGERCLVVYHNRYAEARGWIHTSASYAAPGQEGPLVRKSLGQGLGLSDDPAAFCIFRDHVSGLEFIRVSGEMHERGMYVELGAYQRHVFLGFREVLDNEWHQYAHLASYLDGRGVPSIEEALHEVFLQPIHAPFRELLNAGHLRWLIDHRLTDPDAQLVSEVGSEAERRARRLLDEARRFTGGTGDPAAIAHEIRLKLEAILRLPVLEARYPLPDSALQAIRARLEGDPAVWPTLLGWLFTHALGEVAGDEGFAGRSLSWMEEWLLSKLVAASFQDLGMDEGAAWWAVGTVKILIAHCGWWDLDGAGEGQASQVLMSWLRDSGVQGYLQVNRHRGVLWFNHEAFEELTSWMLLLAAVEISAQPELAPEKVARRLDACYKVIAALQRAEEASEYQVAKLVEAAREPAHPK